MAMLDSRGEGGEGGRRGVGGSGGRGGRGGREGRGREEGEESRRGREVGEVVEEELSTRATGRWGYPLREHVHVGAGIVAFFFVKMMLSSNSTCSRCYFVITYCEIWVKEMALPLRMQIC